MWALGKARMDDMAVTKDEVTAALAKVAAPDGRPLPAARVLSDIVVSDGKVFFSITVDAAAVKAWEPVRKAAEVGAWDYPSTCELLLHRFSSWIRSIISSPPTNARNCCS